MFSQIPENNKNIKVMKTIKFFLTIATVAVVMAATAVEKPKMNVIPLDDEKALIAIANEKPAYFELSIEAKNGDLVYYKESAKEITDLREVINYSDMDNGFYTLKLKVNDTYVSRDFEINNKGMKVGESKMEYAPHFAYSGDVLKLSYLNCDKENVKFKIFNDGGLVFENKLGKDFVISAGYDLSKLEKGKYEIELTSMNNQFSYNIEK
jgi:hypothetical protein